MKYTVADVARFLEVEKEVIKTMAYTFAKYLTSGANPPKKKQREFQIEDIRVMAYISMYWEDKPDIENIQFGLNSNAHYDNYLIDNLVLQLTPFFIDPPENLDESWKHGVLYRGLIQVDDFYYLAKSYRLAGDRLVEAALKMEENWELFCPIIYNYRHATELFLKSSTGNLQKIHDLSKLYENLKELLKSKFNSKPPEWFDRLIESLIEFDPYGIAFRYGDNTIANKVWVDFKQLKILMGWLEKSFHNIRIHQSNSSVL